MRKLFEFEIDDLDDWKRMMCIKMPISEENSYNCETPDGDKGSCTKCRYHVTNNIRRIGNLESDKIHVEKKMRIRG